MDDVSNFDITLKLHSQNQVPPEMVAVGGGSSGITYPLLGSPNVKLDDFLIDRHEVTNEEYQKFVDAGGYTKPEFWKQPFVKDGRHHRMGSGYCAFSRFDREAGAGYVGGRTLPNRTGKPSGFWC